MGVKKGRQVVFNLRVRVATISMYGREEVVADSD